MGEVASMVDDTPEWLRRMWRLPEPEARRGRPAGLTTDRVVDTAVQLADRGGLDAATLPKVAKALDVTAMSLYRHVGSKRELVELMVDYATSPPPPAAAGDGDWRTALADWAQALWDLYGTRPWLLRAPIHGAPSGPSQLAWLEQALAAFSHTDLSAKEKVMYAMLVSGYVRQSALMSHDLGEGLDDSETQSEREHRYGHDMLGLLDRTRFPELSALFESDAFDQPVVPTETTLRKDFRDGLDTILDGIARRVEH